MLCGHNCSSSKKNSRLHLTAAGKIWEFLRNELEMEGRFKTLESKLNLIQDNLKVGPGWLGCWPAWCLNGLCECTSSCGANQSSAASRTTSGWVGGRLNQMAGSGKHVGGSSIRTGT